MQPHQPFVGPQGREFMQDYELRGINEFADDMTQLKLYPAMRYGLLDVSDEKLQELYRENLEVALDSIVGLIDELDGKTIITSDHGELLGDVVGVFPMRGYGHPTPLHVPELYEVPWFELPFESRRKIAEDPPKRNAGIDMNVVDKRLDALGYSDPY